MSPARMTSAVATMRTTRAALAAVAALAASSIGSRPAQAGPAERLAVADFRGPHAGRIQGAVESGLMDRYFVVPDFSVERTARAHGVRLDADGDFGRVGRALEVAGFVSAEVSRSASTRGAWQVRLRVRRGDTGAPVGSFVLAHRRLDGLESQVARRSSAEVQRLLARTTPASPADPGDPGDDVAGAAIEAPPPVETVATAAAAAGQPGAGPTFAELSLDGRVFTRSFSYVQNLSALPGYRLERALAAALDLTLYPLALLRRPLPPLGLVGAIEYAPGVTSRVAGGDQALTTRVHARRLGVKYRMAWSTASLTPQIAHGLQHFQTVGATGAAPDMRYQFVWVGMDGRWAPRPRLALFGGVAYLHGLSVGPTDEAARFPRATADGLAAELGGAFTLIPAVELRLTLGLRRFGLAMHARPGDRWVAGGAIDQTAWVGLGVAYRPGVGR